MTWRTMHRGVAATLRLVGAHGYFLRDNVRALGDTATWPRQTVRQMRVIGVESLVITIIVAAFLGGVTAFQTRYQLFPGVQLSAVGFIARQSIVLELSPLLTALVLTGRVGARMTAEIGTMRVTEQIDALETLAFDPIAYLSLPRILAALVMLPALTMIANAIALVSAWLTLLLATDVRTVDFVEGLRLVFSPFQVVYSMIKAFCFGAAIAFMCAYEGYVADAGAEGVGKATARAVVIASVSILTLDAMVAAILAPFIQS